MSSPNLDPLVKLAWKLGEFALLIGMSTDFLREQIKAGSLRAHRFGRVVLILKEDGQEWLQSQPLYRPDDERQASDQREA